MSGIGGFFNANRSEIVWGVSTIGKWIVQLYQNHKIKKQKQTMCFGCTFPGGGCYIYNQYGKNWTAEQMRECPYHPKPDAEKET